MRKLNALRQKGQGLVEYGLILVLVMVSISIVLLLVGDRIVTMYSTIISTIQQLIQ